MFFVFKNLGQNPNIRFFLSSFTVFFFDLLRFNHDLILCKISLSIHSSDVITARALFKMDHSKSNASHSSGNRKVRHRNGIPCTLDSRQLDDLVRLAEIDIWPILVIHRVAEALSTFFTIDIMDPGVELIRRKCNLLLLMLSRISTM